MIFTIVQDQFVRSVSIFTFINIFIYHKNPLLLLFTQILIFILIKCNSKLHSNHTNKQINAKKISDNNKKKKNKNDNKI
jgi:hypothetical protein